MQQTVNAAQAIRVDGFGEIEAADIEEIITTNEDETMQQIEEELEQGEEETEEEGLDFILR